MRSNKSGFVLFIPYLPDKDFRSGAVWEIERQVEI